MQSPPFPVTSSLLGPNILLNTMFSNTLSFLSTRNVNDQVSHPYKTGKIIVLYINIRINFLFDTMSLKIRMFGLWKYRLSWRDQRWRRFYSTQYIILFELQCFTLFYSVPPPDKCLKLGPRHFFPPTFEFTAYYNPHIQRHTVKTTDVIKQATNKLPHA